MDKIWIGNGPKLIIKRHSWRTVDMFIYNQCQPFSGITKHSLLSYRWALHMTNLGIVKAKMFQAQALGHPIPTRCRRRVVLPRGHSWSSSILAKQYSPWWSSKQNKHHDSPWLWISFSSSSHQSSLTITPSACEHHVCLLWNGPFFSLDSSYLCRPFVAINFCWAWESQSLG